MFARAVMGLVAATAIAALASRVYAIDEKTHEGKVVSVAEGKLVMSDKEGKNEHTHVIPATAKITVDGKLARLADLKQGDEVKVTVDGSGKVSSVAGTHVVK